MPDDDRSSSLREWLEFAESDLEAANALLGNERTWAIVCFHAQQTAEKALKGYLVWLAVDDIPKTHELRVLSALIAGAGGEAPSDETLVGLTRYAVSARYPGTRRPDATDARDAVDEARQILEFVRAAVGAGAAG